MTTYYVTKFVLNRGILAFDEKDIEMAPDRAWIAVTIPGFAVPRNRIPERDYFMFFPDAKDRAEGIIARKIKSVQKKLDKAMKEYQERPLKAFRARAERFRRDVNDLRRLMGTIQTADAHLTHPQG